MLVVAMFLAFREIRRAKVRFALLTGAVGLLVFLMLFINALTSSLITQFIGAIKNQTANVLVYGEQARKNLEGSVIAPNQEQQIRDVAASQGAPVGRLGEGTFTVTAANEKKDAVLFGYDLGQPGAPSNLTAGRLPQRDLEAVASESNKGEGFNIGDKVRVEPGGEAIEIVGLARDINYSVAPTMFVSFPTYEAARKVRNPDAQRVYPSAMALKSSSTSPSALASEINGKVDGVEALTRDQAVKGSPGVASVRTSLNTVVYTAGLIAVIVAGFFFVILTVQKAQALTLLRAIGAPAGKLVRSLLLQVVLVIGGGIIVAVLLLLVARASFSGGGVGVAIEPASILATSATVMVLCLIASWGAIRRVLRIEPIRATQPGGVNG